MPSSQARWEKVHSSPSGSILSVTMAVHLAPSDAGKCTEKLVGPVQQLLLLDAKPAKPRKDSQMPCRPTLLLAHKSYNNMFTSQHLTV